MNERFKEIDKVLLDFNLNECDPGRILDPSSLLIGVLYGRQIDKKEIQAFVLNTLTVGSPGWDKWIDFYQEENKDETESSNSN